MKTKEFKKRLIENYLIQWVKKPSTWIWNTDGTVSVEGNVLIPKYSYPYPKLIVKFDIVTGYFDIQGNKLNTLYNFPNQIKGGMYSQGNLFFNTKEHKKYLNNHVSVQSK